MKTKQTAGWHAVWIPWMVCSQLGDARPPSAQTNLLPRRHLLHVCVLLRCAIKTFKLIFRPAEDLMMTGFNGLYAASQ